MKQLDDPLIRDYLYMITLITLGNPVIILKDFIRLKVLDDIVRNRCHNY